MTVHTSVLMTVQTSVLMTVHTSVLMTIHTNYYYYFIFIRTRCQSFQRYISNT